MGRPKGSKNGKKPDKAEKPEKLNMTVVNRALSNFSDLCADLSLLYREQAQSVQLERELAIQRDAEIMRQTEAFMNKHAPAIQAEIAKMEKAEKPEKKTPETANVKPANLAEIFGVDPDPERK